TGEKAVQHLRQLRRFRRRLTQHGGGHHENQDYNFSHTFLSCDSAARIAGMPNTIETFRELHKSGCFVLPNPWDIGSAVYLEHLGFKALAATSAGFAFSRGLSDDASAHSRDEVLAHYREP